MFDIMGESAPALRGRIDELGQIQPIDGHEAESDRYSGARSNESLDQMTLLHQASSAITAIEGRLYVKGRPGVLREEIPIREVKDTLTAISTLLKSIRDSEAGVRREMSERLFRKAVAAVLTEIDQAGQTHFMKRLRELEAELKQTRLERAA